jgi:[CysO sulfur-carrier protein]-S-L-cysteine hydrolase
LTEAHAAPHTEICGLLSGQNFTITRHFPIPNITAKPTIAYVMEPAALVQAMYAIYAHGEELVAIYHSHPNSLPIPSPTDIAEATYPHALYVIIGGNTMQAWQIQNQAAVSASIEIML